MQEILEPQKILFFEGKSILDICAGQYHSLALTDENELYAWGRGQYGRLGTNSQHHRSEPCRVILGRPEDYPVSENFENDKSYSGGNMIPPNQDSRGSDQTAELELVNNLGGLDHSYLATKS